MSDYMTPDKAEKIISQIIERDNFDGDVRLTNEMIKALNYAIDILKKGEGGE